MAILLCAVEGVSHDAPWGTQIKSSSTAAKLSKIPVKMLRPLRIHENFSLSNNIIFKIIHS
jgi:hypothetical protein